VKCPKCHFDNPADTFFCGKCATGLDSGAGISVTKTLEIPTNEISRGSVFAGRYEIIESLGSGGMGRVFRAFDNKIGEDVALKLIKPEIAEDRKTVERFRNELRIARKITHPNVCRMHDLNEEGRTLYISMEYVRGEDLKSVIRRMGVLSAGKTVSIARQVAEGLGQAHQLGIIHRDLKPHNIMLDSGGNAKIMDFGIARSVRDKGLTEAGAMIGTPEYMSPEQVAGEDIDPRSDIYSLGVVLYEMVTGRVPFEGTTPLGIALKHKTVEPQNPREFNSQIPADLSLLILKCLNKDKEKRFQTATEVISALDRIETGMPTGVQDIRRGPPFLLKSFQTLRERKILETLAAFVGGGWLVLEAVHWILIDHYHLPEESLDIAIVSLLGVMMCTLIWRFLRGGEKKAKKTRAEYLLISAVLLATMIIDASIVRKIKPPESKPSRQAAQVAHKQLTFVGDATYPAISPDGKFIAYVTGGRAGQKMWVQDMLSGQSLEVFGAENPRNLRWTPEGSEISVFAIKDAQVGTFLVPRLGGTPRRIEGFPYIAWSPDGSQFAGFWQAQKDIFIVNRLAGKSTSFSLSGPILFMIDSDWSPSGDRLLVQTVSKENTSSVWTVKTDGSQQNMVIEEKATLSSPRWASKGDAIFYLRGQSVGQLTELWELPISRDTGKPAKTASRVLSGIPMGGVFTLSADGKYFLYTRESRFSNLWLAEIEGSEKSRTIKTRQLTSGTSMYTNPSISPDGKRIAFSRGSGEIMNIFVMPIEGGNPTQLTFFNSQSSNPAWSPDGTEIAFGSNEGGKCKVWKISAQGGRPYQFAKTELSSNTLYVIWSPGSKILYHKAGNRNLQILNPETEEEIPLVKDESVGWIFSPVYSPDGKNVAVQWNRPPGPGIWVISLEDRSEKFIKGEGDAYPFDWSPDGDWVYVYERKPGKSESLMVEVRSGKRKPPPIVPFTIEGRTYYKVINRKPEIHVVGKIQSDVWVIENFDKMIR